MGRLPDGPRARESFVAIRMSDIERSELEEQRVLRGAPTKSAYVRRLLREDGRRIEQERRDRT